MIGWLFGLVIFSNEYALIFSAEYQSNDCTTVLQYNLGSGPPQQADHLASRATFVQSRSFSH